MIFNLPLLPSDVTGDARNRFQRELDDSTDSTPAYNIQDVAVQLYRSKSISRRVILLVTSCVVNLLQLFKRSDLSICVLSSIC